MYLNIEKFYNISVKYKIYFILTKSNSAVPAPTSAFLSVPGAPGARLYVALSSPDRPPSGLAPGPPGLGPLGSCLACLFSVAGTI